jgi:phage repressor protein C with HTH and peptisase S24 domain
LKTVFTAAPSEAAMLAAQEHDGDYALTGIGESMQPCYNPGTALVVHPTSYFMLRTGMPVVYAGRNGHNIAHVLLEETSRGWVAIGLNNSEPDDELVTPKNLLGVVTCAYVPALSLPDRLNRPTYAFVETTGTVLLH